MRVRMVFLHVMHVVRCHQLQAELLRPRDQVPVDLGLLGNAVVLQLEIKIVGTERLLEPIERLARLGQLVLLDRFGDFTGEAAGERDQPFFVRCQQLLVDARLVIIALEVRGGGQLDEILVARLVFGQ